MSDPKETMLSDNKHVQRKAEEAKTTFDARLAEINESDKAQLYDKFQKLKGVNFDDGRYYFQCGELVEEIVRKISFKPDTPADTPYQRRPAAASRGSAI